MAGENEDDEVAKLKARITELEAEKSKLAPVGFSRGFFGCFGVGAAIVVVVVVAVSIGRYSHTPTDSNESPLTSSPDSSSTAGATIKPSAGQTSSPPIDSPWTYSEDTDALTGKKTKTACTTSTNEARLDFPYHNVTAELCIRKSPKFGLDTYVTLNGNGQILCSSYEGCSVRASFDKGKIKTFAGTEAADHSTNIIFISGAARVIAELKKSKSAVIELRFYQAGVQDLTFKTDGLKWP